MERRQAEDVLLDPTEEARAEHVLDLLDGGLGQLVVAVLGLELANVVLVRREGVEEPEELADVVVDRGAGEEDAEAAADGLDGLVQLAVVAALEALALVDDHALPARDLAQGRRLGRHVLVRGQDDVRPQGPVVGEELGLLDDLARGRVAVEGHDVQVRRRPLGELAQPVAEGGHGHDDQERLARLSAEPGALLIPRT